MFEITIEEIKDLYPNKTADFFKEKRLKIVVDYLNENFNRIYDFLVTIDNQTFSYSKKNDLIANDFDIYTKVYKNAYYNKTEKEEHKRSLFAIEFYKFFIFTIENNNPRIVIDNLLYWKIIRIFKNENNSNIEKKLIMQLVEKKIEKLLAESEKLEFIKKHLTHIQETKILVSYMLKGTKANKKQEAYELISKYRFDSNKERNIGKLEEINDELLLFLDIFESKERLDKKLSYINN